MTTDVGKKLMKPRPSISLKQNSANKYTLGSWRASFNPRHALCVVQRSIFKLLDEEFHIRISHTIFVSLACVFSQSYTG